MRETGIVCQEDRTKGWLLGHSKYSASVCTSAINTNKQTVCKYCGDNSKHSEFSDNTPDKDYPYSDEKQETNLCSVHNKHEFITRSTCNSCPVIL